MSDIILMSDTFILLSATLIVGITIIYAIKKWFYSSNYYKSSGSSVAKTTTSDSDGKNQEFCVKDNHYANGTAIKQRSDKLTHNSINNNDSEGSELCDEEVLSATTAKPLESVPQISATKDSVLDSDVESHKQVVNDRIDNSISELDIIQNYEELNPTTDESKVEDMSNLAAFILTNDNDRKWCEIVCITSGCDAINPSYLEPEFVVVDCRAPVLARRCLIRYLYRKLTELVRNEVTEEDSLFTAIPGSNRFELKKNYKLNLYLSEPPDSYGNNGQNIGNGSANGSIRKNGIIRLKSTTDKISIWNQVGVQGSLLSHFIEAIHINSVIIPVEFNERSFHQHFILNYVKEPKLMKCGNILIRDIIEKINCVRTNSPMKVATNWIEGEDSEDSVESIDCETGKAIELNESDKQYSISRLSKHELNKCFHYFLNDCEHNLRPHQSLPMTYRKWKESAPNYRIQKQLLKVRYAVAGRQWTAMSSDLDMFI